MGGGCAGTRAGRMGAAFDMDAEAYLHIVMDAYQGDVVSLPGRLEVVHPGSGEEGGHGRGAPTTVRVEANERLPEPPRAEAWHVRFVGRTRALDARTSDGTLVRLEWGERGLTVTFQGTDALASLDVGPDATGERVTHVLVVPESGGRER